MKPPDGKSGPVTAIMTAFRRASFDCPRRSIAAMTPSMTSRMLCGGILVAMPTAMPADPFTSRFGNVVGRTVGSSVVSS
jgi:hypothetical protein